MADDTDQLTDGLATEVQRAARGESPESVLVLLRDDRLPMALITGTNGMVANKVISYAELLGALDDSAVVSSLENENRRTIRLPELPENTLLMDVHEEPTGRSYALTGYLEPDTYLFCLESNRQGTTATYEIPLPYLVYHVLYDEASGRVERFSLALCSPERGYPATGSTEAGSAGLTMDEGPPEPTTAGFRRPAPDTPVYRYPFSNVYGSHMGVPEGVCWPTLRSVKTTLEQIPKQVVRTFLEMPNNLDLYGRGFSHNGPQEGYTELLEYVEENGLPEQYLIPAGMSVQGLHDQQRDLQQGGH